MTTSLAAQHDSLSPIFDSLRSWLPGSARPVGRSIDAINEPSIEQWRDTGTSTVLFSTRALSLLKRFYTFRSSVSVETFLGTHPFLAKMLIDLHGQLEHFFPESSLVLDISADPEAEYLVVYVVTDSTAPEAIERLERFDDGYWLDHHHQAQGKLIVNVEFA
jgi:hypothetical protein